MVKFVIIVLGFILGGANAFRDNDLTALIPAGKTECFYQSVKDGLTLEIEYQVQRNAKLLSSNLCLYR